MSDWSPIRRDGKPDPIGELVEIPIMIEEASFHLCGPAWEAIAIARKDPLWWKDKSEKPLRERLRESA